MMKIVVLGDSGVGKTSLLQQYVRQKFDSRYRATVGAECQDKTLHIDGQDIHLQIWDTAGQDRFHSLGTAYYRGADVCILVFDLTQQESFAHIASWQDEFVVQSGNHNFVLVGNKADLAEKRAVSAATCKALCTKLDVAGGYFETSAVNSDTVGDAFVAATRLALASRANANGAAPGAKNASPNGQNSTTFPMIAKSQWKPDTALACALCSASFGLVTRRHHCRVCGEVVCGKCSSRKVLCVDVKTNMHYSDQRCCDRCLD